MSRNRLEFDGTARGAQRAAAETRAALKSVGDQADRESVRTSRLGSQLRSSLSTAAVAGGASMLALGGSIGFVGFRFNDLRQKSQIAFETMLGSGTKAKSFLDDLQKFARDTPFEFPDLIRGSQRMLAMGFAAKDILPMLTSVGNAVAAVGGDPQVMEATIRALGQVQAKGRLMAEEMMQFNEAGTFSWRALAGEIGTSVPKAMELVQKGAVTSDIFMAAFQRNTDRRFDGMMDKQSRTFGGLLSTLRDTFAQVSGRVMLPFFTQATRGMQELADRTDDPAFTRGVDRFATSLSKNLFGAARSTVTWFRTNWPEIREFLSESAEAAQDAAEAVGEIADAADTAADAIGGWDDAFKLILAGTLATKLTQLRRSFTLLAGTEAAAAGVATGTGIAGAARGSSILLRNLRALSTIGVITIGIELLINKGQRDAIARWGDQPWINDLADKLGVPAQFIPILGLFAPPRPPGRGAHSPDPRGGGPFTAGAAGGAQPTAQHGAGMVSYTSSAAKSPPKGHVVAFVRRVAAIYGGPLLITSGLRPGATVAGSGSPSQHGTGDAADINTPNNGMNIAVGRAALMAAGMPEDQANKLSSFAGTVNGVNILFQTNIGGNHFNHVHVGLTSLPAGFDEEDRPQTVSPAATAEPADGGAPISVSDPGGKGTPTKGPEKADPAERARGQAGVRAVAQRIGSILPQLRMRFQKQARELLEAAADAKTDEQMGKVTARVEKFKERFAKALELTREISATRKNARQLAVVLASLPEEAAKELRPKLARLQKLLQTTTDPAQVARIKTQLEQLREAVKAVIEKMEDDVDSKRDAFSSAWGRLADKALSVFDAKTAQLLKNARARVAEFGFEIGEGELTPAEKAAKDETPTERAVRERRAGRDADLEAKRIADLERRIGAAATPEEREQLQGELADLRFDAETRRMELQAERERKAADERARVERDAADKALEDERKRIQDERDAKREAFATRLGEIQALISEGKLSATEAQRLLGIALSEAGIDAVSAAQLIGPAFAATLNAALDATTTAIYDLVAAMHDLAKATRDPSAPPLPSPPRGGIKTPEFASGGRVPGRYVGREDTVVGRLTPGEEVLDRSLSQLLRRELAAGRVIGAAGGSPIFVLGATERQVAQALERLVTPEQARSIGYSQPR